jgi:hypothetical protein
VSRVRVSIVLDGLALLLVAAALAIAVTGGATFRVAGTRVTARSADRAMLAALAVVALRIARDRQTPPFAWAGPAARALRQRLYDPSRDDRPALPAETRWRRRGLALAGIVLFGAVLLFPQLRHMDAVPDLGDPLFSMWRFGWVYQQMLGDPRPLFSTNIFYPHQLTLTYSDSMLVPALTTAPLLAAGMHPVHVYNVVMLLAFVASGFAVYLLVERISGSPAGAYVAAILFAFYPYRFEHYSHFELQMTYCMPLALLALHQFATTARVKSALAASLLSVAQLYSSMYYAVFFTMYASIVFALTCWVQRVPVRRLVGPAIAASVIALAMAWPLARTYSSARLGDRDPNTVTFYSATAADYLRAHPRSAVWGMRTLPGRSPERALFPGLTILVLVIIALAPPIGPMRAVYAGALVAAFEISRGFNSPIYPYLYDWLPFIRGLRVPARASILVGLSLAVLAGFGVRRLIASGSRARRWALLSAIVVAIGVDVRPILQLERVWREPPPIYGAVTNDPKAVLVEFPLGGFHRTFTANVPFMYFSMWHWANLVNGYSGHSPPGQEGFEVAMQPFPDPATMELLRGRGATHVSVNCALYMRGCDALVARLDAAPELRLVSAGRWEGQPVRLYEVTR